MTKRIAGITGVTLWAALIAAAVIVGLQAKVNGEEIFDNLGRGWKVESSFTAQPAETAAISHRLGGRITKLTNTVISFEGQKLQVNVMHCPTSKDADIIYQAVLDGHDGVSAAAAREDKVVIEFAKCNDVNLMNKTRRALGLADVRLDSVASKVIRKIPDGWRIENSFIVPRDQTAAIGKKLGGRIKNLSNTIFSVEGKRFQVNVVECATPRAAEAIYNSILATKGDPAFCLRLDNMVVEFIGSDIKLAKKAVYELGIKPMPIETLAKGLVNSLASRDYKKAVENFDETMKKALPAEKLQQVWNSIIAQSGAFIKQLGTRKQEILGHNIIFVTCKFERATLDTKVVFNRDKQIAGLFFVPAQSQ
jgi:hypothetical protein